MHPYGSQLWLLNRHLPLEKEPSHSIKITLVLIVFPITQIHTKKRGGYFASFVSMLYSLAQCYKNEEQLLCHDSICYRECGQKAWQSQGLWLCASQREVLKSTPCAVSEKTWNIKENKGKSIIRILYLLQLMIRYVLGQSNINQRKINPIALSIVELCLAECIS